MDCFQQEVVRRRSIGILGVLVLSLGGVAPSGGEAEAQGRARVPDGRQVTTSRARPQRRPVGHGNPGGYRRRPHQRLGMSRGAAHHYMRNTSEGRARLRQHRQRALDRTRQIRSGEKPTTRRERRLAHWGRAAGEGVVTAVSSVALAIIGGVAAAHPSLHQVVSQGQVKMATAAAVGVSLVAGMGKVIYQVAKARGINREVKAEARQTLMDELGVVD
jgi:hypothetical protein